MQKYNLKISIQLEGVATAQSLLMQDAGGQEGRELGDKNWIDASNTTHDHAQALGHRFRLVWGVDQSRLVDLRQSGSRGCSELQDIYIVLPVTIAASNRIIWLHQLESLRGLRCPACPV